MIKMQENIKKNLLYVDYLHFVRDRKLCFNCFANFFRVLVLPNSDL